MNHYGSLRLNYVTLFSLNALLRDVVGCFIAQIVTIIQREVFMFMKELSSETPAQLLPLKTQNFDYNALDAETRVVVQQRTSEIKVLIRRQAQDTFDIGQKLLEVKAKLGHGHFGSWLMVEFELSWETANRFMNVAKHLGQIPTGAEFEAKALYLLASPSTPEEARFEAKERASRGEKITLNKAKEIRSQHNCADAVQTKAKPKQATVDVPAFTLERESPSSDDMELLEDESEFAEIEPTRYATPPQTLETVGNYTVKEEEQDDQELAEEGEPATEVVPSKLPDQLDRPEESPPEVQEKYLGISTESQQIDRTQTKFNVSEENKESNKIVVSVEQTELEETVEVRDSQTTFEKIYLFLISQAKEYVPNFPNARFSEVDEVIKQIAEDSSFSDLTKLGQLGQEQLEEILQAVPPQITANSLSLHDWSISELESFVQKAQEELEQRKQNLSED